MIQGPDYVMYLVHRMEAVTAPTNPTVATTPCPRPHSCRCVIQGADGDETWYIGSGGCVGGTSSVLGHFATGGCVPPALSAVKSQSKVVLGAV